MRAAVLNVLTCGATLLLLVVLALPATKSLQRPAAQRAEATPPEPAEHPARVFGVYVDPWHVDDWAGSIGAAPQAVAKFEAFSRDRTVDEYAAESARQGIRRMLVSWEPWTPVPAALAAAPRPHPAHPNPRSRWREVGVDAMTGHVLENSRERANPRD